MGKLGVPCRVARCPEIVTDGTNYCTKHKKEAPKPFSQKKVERLALYSSSRWQSLRLRKLAMNPICEVCNKVPAVAVHHVKQARFNPELHFDLENLQSICHSCHAAESAREAADSRLKGMGKENERK